MYICWISYIIFYTNESKDNNIFPQTITRDAFKSFPCVLFAHSVNSGNILCACAKDFIGEELLLHLIMLDLHVHGVPLIQDDGDRLIPEQLYLLHSLQV